MPISLRVPIRRLTQQEFGGLAFEVMRHVFAIHNEIGRFFDERIYKRELANRLPNTRLEEPIDITFASFHKRLFIDVLVNDGGLFEFKAVDRLGRSHRSQFLNYLLLCELAHGKLINVRPHDVEHEFVNSTLRLPDRREFTVDQARWNSAIPGGDVLQDILTPIMRDWGTGLDIGLYEEAITYLFGGAACVEADLPVVIAGRKVGTQRVRLIAPGVALKLTALNDDLNRFEHHARRLLTHFDLRAIAWVNFNMKQLTYTTLER